MSFPVVSVGPQLQSFSLGPITLHWLPPTAIVEERCADAETTLAAQIASPARRHEFVRSRQLFHQLSESDCPVGRGARGEPIWPPGWNGSISHKLGHVVLAYVPENTLQGLGIDIEPPVPLSIERRVCSAKESLVLNGCHQLTREELLAAVFSAKEALFKCLYPLGRTVFYFRDAQLEQLDLAAGVLSFRLQRNVAARRALANQVIIAHACKVATDKQEFIATAVAL